MRNIPAPLQSLMVGGLHRFVYCWKIVRKDGVTYRFTDHDVKLTVDGEEYLPSGSFSSSARQYNENSTSTNLDVQGSISSTLITAEDLRAGKYREAKVTEFVVDHRFPFAGKFLTNIYDIQDTTFDTEEQWTAKLVSQKNRLRRSKGDLFTKSCRWVLGDSNCGVTLTPVTGSVSSVTDRAIFDTGLSQPEGYFEYGLLTWTSGDNDGLSFEVKSFASGEFELQTETPFNIQIGDDFSVVRGCDQLIETCANVFNNVENFGGYPDIPGNDKAFTTPDSQ
jgi:uncharacterized phage protein (TIGR02218 family)